MPISHWPNDRENIKYLSGVIINGGIALGVAVTWAFGKPFIKNYVEDNVGIEGATHPTVMHMIKRLTTMWLVAFTLMTLVSLVPAVMQLQGSPNSTAFMVCNIITWIILAVCLTVAFWFYIRITSKNTKMSLRICTRKRLRSGIRSIQTMSLRRMTTCMRMLEEK